MTCFSWKCQYNQLSSVLATQQLASLLFFLRNLLNKILRVWFWENRINILCNKLNLTLTISVAILLTCAYAQEPLLPLGSLWCSQASPHRRGLLLWSASSVPSPAKTQAGQLQSSARLLSQLHLGNYISTPSNSVWIKILMRTSRWLTAALPSYFHQGICAGAF